MLDMSCHRFESSSFRLCEGLNVVAWAHLRIFAESTFRFNSGKNQAKLSVSGMWGFDCAADSVTQLLMYCDVI